MTLEYVWSFRHTLVVALVGAGMFMEEERWRVSLG
jgi:hypothetical protein